MLTLTAAQMRTAEQLANARGVPYAGMMENAGKSAASYLMKSYAQPARFTVILAGKGNNGGDGFVAAKMLAQGGCTVVVVLCMGAPESGIAADAYRAMTTVQGVSVIDAHQDINHAVHALQSATLLVDAVFGTGFHGAPDQMTAFLLETANAVRCVRVSLDLPSGIQADDGMCAGICFMAHLTLAFAAYKPAHCIPQAAGVCGKVVVLDIGIPEAVLYASLRGSAEITKASVQSWLPKRMSNAHKGTYGRLLILAGSRGMMGAAMMPTLSAMRTGSGLTTLAAPKCVVQAVAPLLMEAMTLPLAQAADGAASAEAIEQLGGALLDKTAVLAGCGLRVTKDSKQLVEYIIENTNGTIILDADALSCLADSPSLLKRAKSPVIITPHIGEMARLTGQPAEQVAARQAEVAQGFSREYDCVTVLKSHRTVTAAPDGTVWLNTTGNASLAKGGSGDVLAGMIASLAAQGMEPVSAAICAVWMHGFAADRLAKRMSQYSVLARDLIDELPFALKELDL